MSGGAWDYLSYKLEEMAENAQRYLGALRLLAAIEHEMDWGISGDTCYECAKLRVIAALETFFDGGAQDDGPAVAVARDGKQNLCPKCLEREKQRQP